VTTARRERFTGTDGVTRDYTGARINTSGRFEQAYGRFEARLQIPSGKGLWPAFWLLGGDIGRVGWPACGEIDIRHTVGLRPPVLHHLERGRRRELARETRGRIDQEYRRWSPNRLCLDPIGTNFVPCAPSL